MGVFSSFYGQHSVTAAWATPRPWINDVFGGESFLNNFFFKLYRLLRKARKGTQYEKISDNIFCDLVCFKIANITNIFLRFWCFRYIKFVNQLKVFVGTKSLYHFITDVTENITFLIFFIPIEIGITVSTFILFFTIVIHFINTCIRFSIDDS